MPNRVLQGFFTLLTTIKSVYDNYHFYGLAVELFLYGKMKRRIQGHNVYITAGDEVLKVKVNIPENAIGIVIMCDDWRESEILSRNELVSQIFQKECFVTLHVVRENPGICDGSVVLPALTGWIANDAKISFLPLFVFCSGESANNVLLSLIDNKKNIAAVVIRSGIIGLDAEKLSIIDIPVLLLNAERDQELIDKNTELVSKINSTCFNLKIIAGASRHFTELGKLGYVTFLAVEWFRKNMIKKAISA